MSQSRHRQDRAAHYWKHQRETSPTSYLFVPPGGTAPLHETTLQKTFTAHDQCAWLADPRCEHEYQPRFEPQVIHGDYQHANLFFDANGVSGIIDWEQAACMPRAFEAARAAAYMFDVAPEPTRALLQAYRSVTGISDEELDDGARAWGCMSDHYVWALEEVYLHGNERARPFIPERFRPFRTVWEAARQ